MSDNSLAARAAWLSFIGGYTQSEIAKRLDVSSAKAHRLISQAQKAGLVRVFVEGVPAECVELEEFIIQRFGLESCIVAPRLGDPGQNEDAEPEDPQTSYNAVGVAAARQLHNLLNAGDATSTQPITSSISALHLVMVIFLPKIVTANAAVATIFN